MAGYSPSTKAHSATAATRAGKHVRVHGMPELLQKLRGLGQTAAIERIAFRGTIGAAKDLKEQAYVNAALALNPPADSGALLRAWAIKKIKIGSKRGYTVGMRAGRTRIKPRGMHFMGPMPGKQVGAEDAFYWTFLEFGTVHIQARGFFRRAIADQKEAAMQMVMKQGRKAVLDSGNRVLKQFGSGKSKGKS